MVDHTQPEADDAVEVYGRHPARLLPDPSAIRYASTLLADSSPPPSCSPESTLNAVLLLSIAIALAALAGGVVLFRRSDETRVGWLIALPALIATAEILGLWTQAGRGLGLDAATAGALLGLAASAVTAVALVGAARTLIERDRAEALHWDAMASVRALCELETPGADGATAASLDEKLVALLDIGRRTFEVDVAWLARNRGEDFEVASLLAPESFPLARGAGVAHGDSFCGIALRAERPLAIDDAGDSSFSDHPARRVLACEVYLGTAVRVGEELYGVLCFYGSRPRENRFTATDKDLLLLMARWVGHLLERERAPRATSAPALRLPAAAIAAPVRPRPAAVPAPAPPSASVDPNAVLRGLSRGLRRLVGPGVRLEVALAPDLRSARAPAAPLKDIVRSLALHAVDAMPEGGRLRIETANLDPPANAPASEATGPHVILRLRHTGCGPEADAFARSFDRATTPLRTHGSNRRDARRERLPLVRIRRALQRAGGDLSVSLEPGRGSTLTLYLRSAPDASAPERPTPRAATAQSA